MRIVDERRRLKLLHIDPERSWGGGESQVLGLLSYLSLQGHQNHLLCHPDGPLFREARKKGLAVFPLSIRNEIDLRPIFSLRSMIRREAYDIVHFHTKRAHALSLWLGRNHRRARYVVTRRMDYPPRRNWHTHFLYNRMVDGIIAISHKIADSLLEGGVRKEKIRIIPSGIDPAPFQTAHGARPDSGPPVIGTVAVLEKRKGHRFLLEAAALLKQQGQELRFRLAGEGSEKEHLQRIALSLGLSEEVSLLGFVSDIPSFLSAIDVFVLPSLYEGLGVAVLEAMAAAQPVVATRVGGLPELVEDQVTGLLVPARDSVALARSISQLVSQKRIAEEMGARGWERVRQHFTVEQMAKKNEDFYYELLEEVK